jgi:adenylyl-sulfate kinase
MLKNTLNKGNFVLWMTGLPCSGKTTLAKKIQRMLDSLGHKTHHLDGDIFRFFAVKKLNFSQKDRNQNIANAIQVAQNYQNEGYCVVVSFISPYRKHRELAKEKLKNCIEIFVDAPLKICEQRDSKGMYRKARVGEIRNFTGIQDSYEEPEQPQIHLKTHEMTVDECLEKVSNSLNDLGYIRSIKSPVSSKSFSGQTKK